MYRITNFKILRFFSYIFIITTILAIIISFYLRNFEDLFLSILILFLLFLPSFIEKKARVYLPFSIQFGFIFLIYGGLFLGSLNHLYDKFPVLWDFLLHLFSGALFGFLGFVFLYILYVQNKIIGSYLLISVFSFSFALSLGAIWEIFEFVLDLSLGFNMQESGIPDTMGDLISDSIGALFVSIFGYIYLKYKKNNIIGIHIEETKRLNPHIFGKIKEKIKEKIKLKNSQNK